MGSAWRIAMVIYLSLIHILLTPNAQVTAEFLYLAETGSELKLVVSSAGGVLLDSSSDVTAYLTITPVS